MLNQTAENNTAACIEVLRWYSEMGVDEALDEAALDWFEKSGRQGAVSKPAASAPQIAERVNVPAGLSRQQSEPPRQQGARSFPVISLDGAATEAREKARTAESLEELETILRNFDGCGLKATAKNTCISRGSPQAKLMLIGEAPGRDEDIQGIPFVGRAGQLLDRMLASIGRNEENTYITNIVYWRPPGNRTPTPQEAQICRPFLERQIELVNPDIIVFLGGAAAKHMLNATEGIMKLRGKWKDLEVGGRTYRSVSTLHPAYLLRTPAGKKLAWKDFLAIKHAAEPAD